MCKGGEGSEGCQCPVDWRVMRAESAGGDRGRVRRRCSSACAVAVDVVSRVVKCAEQCVRASLGFAECRVLNAARAAVR